MPSRSSHQSDSDSVRKLIEAVTSRIGSGSYGLWFQGHTCFVPL